jgi:hypothetical protein
LPELNVHEFREILFIGIPGEIEAETVDYRGVSLEGVEEGVSLDGGARIGEGPVDPMMGNVRWAGKRIYKGKAFSLRRRW